MFIKKGGEQVGSQEEVKRQRFRQEAEQVAATQGWQESQEAMKGALWTGGSRKNRKTEPWQSKRSERLKRRQQSDDRTMASVGDPNV
jgi:hypothetical protein